MPLRKKFHLPKPGDKFPPAENQFENNPAADNQRDVNENLLHEGQQDAFNKTAKAVDEYLGTSAGPDAMGNPTGTFGNWLTEYRQGRLMGPLGQGDPDAPPPPPPNGFMAVAIASGDVVAYESQQIGPPACDIPAYEKIAAPQHYKK